MAIAYTNEDRNARPLPRGVRMLVLINFALAGAVLSAWTYVAVFLADPIAWATWIRVYRTGDLFLDLLDYPFVLLWGLPLGAVCAAWTACKAHMNLLAYACAILPPLGLTLIVTWYHLAPPEWR